MTSAEFNALKLSRSVAAQLASAPIDPGGWLIQGALPFGTLGACRRRGLVSEAFRIPSAMARTGTRMASQITPAGEALRLKLAKLEEAWPGTLERWATDYGRAKL